jgi:hypothetical protein
MALKCGGLASGRASQGPARSAANQIVLTRQSLRETVAIVELLPGR